MMKLALRTTILALATTLAAPGAFAARAKPHARVAAKADQALALQIRRNIVRDEDIGANLQVKSAGGVVTVSGVASNVFAKHTALQTAATTKGVKKVIDRMVVGATKPGVKMPSDAQIAQRVRTLFSYDSFLGPWDLGVSVRGGQVSLVGQVPSAFHKQRAEELSGRITGVRAVTNTLSIAAQPTRRADTEVARAIQDSLTRNTLTARDKISVQVTQGVVTLSGQVANWNEAKAASQLSYEGGGKIVRNFLATRNDIGATASIPPASTTTSPSAR